MAGMSSNLENIIGVKIPPNIRDQIIQRIKQNSKENRDVDNLLYLANKTGWIRVISSVNVRPDETSLGTSDEAEKYVLFGGTSFYKDKTYGLREGLSTYNLTGNQEEIAKFGFRAMPGITSAKIMTQGRLGSVRAATINFTVNDKDQLDIIDKLYFKPGFSIIIEWGNTIFYKNNGTLGKGEDYLLDPFHASLTKENIIAEINQKVEDSNGNYDGMLGIITNFSFSFNKDGSFDCVLSAQGLGVLGEGIRVNNANELPSAIFKQDVNKITAVITQQTENARRNVDTSTVTEQQFSEALQTLASVYFPYGGTPQSNTGNVTNYANTITSNALNLPQSTQPTQAQLDAAQATVNLFRTEKGITLEVPNSGVLDYLNQQKAGQAAEEVNTVQKSFYTQYSSFLESFLIGVKLHCFNQITDVLIALNAQTAEDTKDSAYAYEFNLYNNYKKYLQDIFSNGALTKIITSESTPQKDNLFLTNAYYGFNRALLEAGIKDRETIISSGALKPIKDYFPDIFRAYVLTNKQDQDLYQGAGLNNPSYIPLSFFLAIVNHAGLLYEQSSKKSDNSPIVAIDFHPETNSILCNPQTISVDPYKFLIKFQAGYDQYKQIFNPADIQGDKFKDGPKGAPTTPIWNPNTDRISPSLPDFRVKGTFSAYKGKVMNVLVNIDYLLRQIKSHSNSDDNNAVYLQKLMESILFDMNKSLGGFNALRFAYSDKGNCFYISDDQYIPAEDKTQVLQPTDIDYTEIPAYGQKSIVEDMKLQTDMSTRLSSWLAISANANADYQATAGTDTTPAAIYNKYYVDRYKENLIANQDKKKEEKTTKKSNSTTVDAAVHFNDVISSFYTNGNQAENKVDGAINFYIDKMAKLKSEDPGSKASLLIPVSLNFTTDGISGFAMGQAFVVNDNLLPQTYINRDATKKVGFIVTGAEHNIAQNRWKTNIKASMYYLKKTSDYSAVLGSNTAKAGAPPIAAAAGSKVANPQATKVLQDMLQLYGSEGATNAGIWPSPQHMLDNPNSDHNTGDAADIGVNSIALGDKIVNTLISQAKDRGIDYLIFNNRIWYPGSGWKPYNGKSSHTDHVHVNFYNS